MKIWNEPSNTRADLELSDFEKVRFALQESSCETIFTTILSFKCHTLGEISNFENVQKYVFNAILLGKKISKVHKNHICCIFFEQKERVRVY